MSAALSSILPCSRSSLETHAGLGSHPYKGKLDKAEGLINNYIIRFFEEIFNYDCAWIVYRREVLDEPAQIVCLTS